jgi:hypothetical protein
VRYVSTKIKTKPSINNSLYFSNNPYGELFISSRTAFVTDTLTGQIAPIIHIWFHTAIRYVELELLEMSPSLEGERMVLWLSTMWSYKVSPSAYISLRETEGW